MIAAGRSSIRLAVLAGVMMLVGPRAGGQRADHSVSASADDLVVDTVSFASGALTLHGVVYRPAKCVRCTAILFNHGSGKDYTPEVAAVGPSYARLGYVFFAPSRRGQWLSVGTGQYIVDSLDVIERTAGKGARDSLLVSLMRGPQLRDVAAAREWLARQAYVDPKHVVVAGNSFGGIVTMLAAARLDGVCAAVNFAGAAQTWAGSPALQAMLIDAAKGARVPVFFGQAENDYDLTPSRVMSAAMSAAGKPNVLRIFAPFGTTTAEGHSLGYFGGGVWGADVAAFVTQMAR